MTSLIHVKWLEEINGSCLKDVNVYIHILLLDAPNCNKDGNITCIFVFHSQKDQKEKSRNGRTVSNVCIMKCYKKEEKCQKM